MYVKKNEYQMTFSDQFFCTDDDPVSDDHLYMKLVNLLNWDALLEQLKDFYSKKGRKSIPIKNMVILLMVKHMTNDSDEQLVERIGVDMALQKALNIPFKVAHAEIKYITKGKKRIRKVRGYIDPSSLTKFRKKIELKGVELINKSVDELLHKHKLIRSKTVLVDTTVSPSNVAYPTDMRLLNDAREYLVKLIKKFSHKKVRTKCRLAKKFFLNFIKLKSKDRANTKSYQQQMMDYVSLNLKQAKKAIQQTKVELGKSSRDKLTDVLTNVENLLQQQKEVYKQTGEDGSKKGIKVKNRIISLYKPHVRPIPRGKVGKPIEFGAKILYEARNSFLSVLNITFENVADSEMLKEHFPRWKGLILGGDRGFHSKENTSLAEQHKLRGYYIEKKGKNKTPVCWSQKQTRKKRAGIEAKFSLLKRRYGLNKNLYGRGEKGEKQWIFLSATAHNLSRAFSLI